MTFPADPQSMHTVVKNAEGFNIPRRVKKQSTITRMSIDTNKNYRKYGNSGKMLNKVKKKNVLHFFLKKSILLTKTPRYFYNLK